MNIWGDNKEFKTQLHFYDDSSFEFKKRSFVDSCLVQMKDNMIEKAWKHFYSSEIRFDGYGSKMKADGVTLSFDRDFILDPFNKVKETDSPNGGKPKSKKDEDIRQWTASVAEAQRYKVMNKPGNMLLLDKITMFLGIGLIMELLLWGASRAWHW